MYSTVRAQRIFNGLAAPVRFLRNAALYTYFGFRARETWNEESGHYSFLSDVHENKADENINEFFEVFVPEIVEQDKMAERVGLRDNDFNWKGINRRDIKKYT